MPDPEMDWKSMTDRAAVTTFWNELFKGECFVPGPGGGAL